MIISHSPENLDFIKSELGAIGILNYRFCVENDCYICTPDGNFYSICKRQYSKSGNLIEKYRIQELRGSLDRYGYTTYRILVDGRKKHLKAHRMMLNAWCGEQPDLVVNHKDGNKQNNELKNLEWCTVAENNAHAIATGLFNPRGKKEFPYTVSCADWMTVYILHRHCGYSLSQLGRMYTCTHSAIKAIIDRIDRVMPKEGFGNA